MDFPAKEKGTIHFWGILIIVFLSRLPFLLPGYGAEEDAWGLYITAKNISQNGIYEVSRLPGHPLQEYVYSVLWQYGPLAFNLLTALLSTTTIAFFVLSLKKLKLDQYLVAGIILAFIPVVYINSVNAMDYMWALAFIMMAFYFLINQSLIAAGILLGLAVGCRITSAAMIIPFVFWIFDRESRNEFLKKCFRLILPFTFISVLAFLPVLLKYGTGFFSYVAQIPATFMQAVYRGTIGVWGLIGFIDIVTILFMVFIFRSKSILNENPKNEISKKLVRFCLLVILLYLFTFCMLPQKAAFFIPMLPFVIILLHIYLSRISFVAFSFSMIFSSFFIGVNLNDSLRGSTPSDFSFDFRIAGQNISLDFLRGPVISDQVKRKNKIEFSEKIIGKINLIQRNTVIIAGFWMNDILAKIDSLPSNVALVYYADEPALKKYVDKGYEIFYLTEQDYFNDVCFKKEFTKKYSIPFPLN